MNVMYKHDTPLAACTSIDNLKKWAKKNNINYTHIVKVYSDTILTLKESIIFLGED